MLLSVRLMTYNHKDFIEDALRGIDSQITDFNFEVVVGDDFSADDTLLKISNFKITNPKLSLRILDRKIGDNYYITRKHRGRLYNFIDIVNNCKGKYIALLDGDDYWTDPLKLQKQVDFLENNEDYILCFHKVSIRKPNGDIIEDYITKVPEHYEKIENFVQNGNYIHIPSVVYRNCIKNFPFEFTLVPFGDFFLFFMLGHFGKFKYLKSDMAVYRTDVGMLSKMNTRDMTTSYVTLYSCMMSFTPNENLKKLILEKQKSVLKSYFFVIEDNYLKLKAKHKKAFVSNHSFFKWIKNIQTTYWKFNNKNK